MTLRKVSTSSDDEQTNGNDNNYDDDDEEEEIYEVEKILDHKVDSRGKRRFFLKWKGYPNEDNTWESEENLDCPELLAEYLEKAKIFERENLPKGKLIERPTDIAKCHLNKNNELIYTAVYKNGKRKDFTSKELFKLTPSLQINYLEKIAQFPEES